MSDHRNNGKSPKPELKLNLSLLPRGEPSTLMRMETDDDDDDDDDDSLNRMSISSSSGQSLPSPPSSCVSSEDSPTKAMVLAGCSRCLMYVMLSKDEEPKCTKCKNAVLLDFGHDQNKNKNGKS